MSHLCLTTTNSAELYKTWVKNKAVSYTSASQLQNKQKARGDQIYFKTKVDGIKHYRNPPKEAEL